MSNYNKEINPEKNNNPFIDMNKALRIGQKHNAVCKILGIILFVMPAFLTDST